MIRSHGMATGELGVWLALTFGVGGGIGTFCAGMFADKLALRDKRWYAWLPALAPIISGPFFITMMLADNATVALTVNIGSILVANAYLGASIAVVHGLVGAQMRAVASASTAVSTGRSRRSSRSTAGPAHTCMVLRGQARNSAL